MSCQVCKRDGEMKWCSLCHTGSYCSRKCQKEYWFEHKLSCLQLRLFLDSKVCDYSLRKRFGLLRKNFRNLNNLPDILCNPATWKEYPGCQWDLFMLSKLILNDSMNKLVTNGLSLPFNKACNNLSIEIDLVRELLRIGSKSMIMYLESKYIDKKCF